MFKRSVDILFAGLLLMAVLPVLLLAALAIKVESEGPALFCQVRMGRRFKRFRLYKLRSMRSGPGPAVTLGDDTRITRVGAFLRWSKIDELPQLWNVLRGDMSLVGPRPVVPEVVGLYPGDYQQILQVRPGLTDPATLKYCRETQMLAGVGDPAHYFQSVVAPDKLRLSREYLKYATPWTDFAILLRTALVLVPGMEHFGRLPLHVETHRRAVVLAFQAPERRQPAFALAAQGGLVEARNITPIRARVFDSAKRGRFGAVSEIPPQYREHRKETTFAS